MSTSFPLTGAGDLGSVINSSCLLSEKGNISHFLRKISTDINEIKGMKAVLRVEANLVYLSVSHRMKQKARLQGSE